MSRLELALNPNGLQSKVESHETENEIDTERLYSILQEQDQILERNAKQPSLCVDVDVDQVNTEEEKENTFCSRSKWLGTPEFYNEFMSTKDEYENVILETYTMSAGAKRKAETCAGEPKKLKIDTEDHVPEEITANTRKSDENAHNSIQKTNSSSSIDAENWDDDSNDNLLPWQDVDYQNLAIRGSLSSASGIFKFTDTYKEFIIVVSDIDSESDEDEDVDAGKGF